MKEKILLTLGMLCFFVNANAQLYVNPGSYVFMTNQFMYVTQDVNIQNTGNFYMRNTAQLLQGTAGASTNFGAGKLSLFQEGTTNNFQYNYWCSPVGAASGIFGNEQFGITLLNRPTGLITSTAATILPTNNYNGTSSPLAIAPYWIWKFVTSTTYAQWAYVGSATSVNPGEGFTMKGTSGSDATVVDADGVQNNSGSRQRYDFRGKPNDGTISVPVSAGNFTLVGNPYPSAIDLNAYLLNPANALVIDGAARFWEQVVVNTHTLNQYQGGYGIYTPGLGYTAAAFWTYDGLGNQGIPAGSGTNFQRRFSPVGQGFMVMGTAAGSVTMRNSFRAFVREAVVNQSEFAKNTNQAASTDVYDPSSEYFPEIPNVAGIDYTQVKKTFAPQLKIYAMYNDGGVRPTTLGFDDNATDGFDYGWDGRSPSGEAAEFYYILEGTTNEYVASAVQFDINKKVPVGFRCSAQTNFKVQVKEVLNGFDPNQAVYMHDKVTGIYYDIKSGIFDMTLPAGDNKTRFEITFKNTDDTLPTPDEASNMFVVVQNNEQGMLTIQNSLLKDITSLSLYDVTGKLVLSKLNLGSAASYQFSTASLSDGVYVVTATTADNVNVSKKISVYKK